jgi:hypothetical protein
VPVKGKGKQQVQRSPRKQQEVTIVLPCIPTGVKVVTDLLGCVDKLCYSDHDVRDTDKFPEFMQQVYLERRGVKRDRSTHNGT